MTTENCNERSAKLDQMTTLQILQCMNTEDRGVPQAVGQCLEQISSAVDRIVERMQNGGKLFYVGAGTSGRIGALDAYECSPTFGTDPSLVQAVVAGGSLALIQASEEAEDEVDLAKDDLKEHKVSANDVVIGISASGSTPYVAGALQQAREIGAATVTLSCNSNSPISQLADIAIEVITGPEVLTGSTRLKAGAAQKLILNMISTAVMVKLGKVYGNYMVDVRADNDKLRTRAKHIVKLITDADEDVISSSLTASNYNVKESIVMLMAEVDLQEARDLLEQSDYRIREALHSYGKTTN